MTNGKRECRGKKAKAKARPSKVIKPTTEHLLKEKEPTKTQMAARMKTSRAAADRLFDASNSSLTLNTPGKAAHALGHKVQIELVRA